MNFVFKNKALGDLVYKFFDETAVQEQIEGQWDDSTDYILLTTCEACRCKTHDEFNNTCVSLQIGKKELLPRMEYRPEQWNPCPQVVPPCPGWYLVTVQLLNGEVKTEMDWYYSDDDRWEEQWKNNGPQDVLAFMALPSPYEPKKE